MPALVFKIPPPFVDGESNVRGHAAKQDPFFAMMAASARLSAHEALTACVFATTLQVHPPLSFVPGRFPAAHSPPVGVDHHNPPSKRLLLYFHMSKGDGIHVGGLEKKRGGKEERPKKKKTRERKKTYNTEIQND